MEMILKILIGVIAAFHVYIMVFEMFLWETRGRKVFRRFPRELFSQTKELAANQGLYNGFLAAGLIWTFFIDDLAWRGHIALFFLSCVAVAGIFGALTADRKIFLVQALPAIVGIILLLVGDF